MVQALAALGVAAYQGYKAYQQKKAANKLKPSNYTPPSVNEATANARADANATVTPGYARGLEKVRQSTSNSINSAKRLGLNPAQLQQTVSDADAREKEIIKDMEVNNEEFRLARRQDLNRALQIKGSYEKDSMDDFNATKSALIGASEQNKWNAITTAGEGVINALPDSAFKTASKTKTAVTPTMGKKSAPSSPGMYDSDPSKFSTGMAMGKFGSGGRGMSRFRNMKLSPLEESILRSRGYQF